jgi:D-glycero-beta-D-manno-heptose-7-phosphate kinase
VSRPRNAKTEPTAILDRFCGRRVVVLGDFVCDEFVHGDIARVSREAPVLILEHARTEVVPGGAGNTVANLRALGADPVPVGIVGPDEAGHALVAALKREGIDVSGIGVERSYVTPTKSRILAGGVHTRRQQIVRVDRGARHGSLAREVVARIERRAVRMLRGSTGLLVADYGYGAAPPALVRRVRGPGAARTTTVDSRGRVASFPGVTACTPNQEEVERALGLPGLSSDRAVAAAGAALLERTRDEAVLVTRGARGMMLFERGQAPLAIPAFGAGEVADVTGAGDTVIAAFTLARLAGASFAEAAHLANVAAGLVVMKYGTAVVTPGEISRAMARAGTH